MSQKDSVALSLAIIIAIGTTLLARALFHSPETSPQVAPQTTQTQSTDMPEILIVTDNLNIGTTIKPSHIQWQHWPKKSLLDSYIIRNDEDEDQYQKILGSLLKRSLTRGEPITLSDVIKKGENSFLSAIVRPGMRAISIPLKNTAAGESLLSPGDMVDVISANLHTNTPGSGASQDNFSGRTLAQNVRILTIDQRIGDRGPNQRIISDNNPKFITLEVSPAQAEILAMALKLGDLTFSLRGLQSDDMASQPDKSKEAVTLAELKKQIKDQKPSQEDYSKASQLPKHQVRIIRAENSTKITFKGDEIESSSTQQTSPTSSPSSTPIKAGDKS